MFIISSQNYQSEFWNELVEDKNYSKAIKNYDNEIVSTLEDSLVHNFRYYQKEAVLSLNYFLELEETNYFKEQIAEEEYDNIPFYGFQMATGSGKTLLIGANILQLHLKNGTKNFLVLTPDTTIYEKTIRNFNLMKDESVFQNNLEFDFNLITGENYQDRRFDYDEDADFNIFVFNISKFYDRENGTLKIDKEWEESIWEDNLGNTISLREYLRNNELAIVTDEAHHYQKFRVGRRKQSSGDIILDLEPELVVEYTATARLEDKDRRNQKIIYNYPLDSFIKDGYAKKIRAYGYRGAIDKSTGSEVTKDDKKKLFVSLMTHLLKKEALKQQNFKPILLVRARGKDHAENLNEYLAEGYEKDDELIEKTYNEIAKAEKYDLIELISNNISLDDLKSEIKDLGSKSFAFHHGNSSKDEVKKKFDNIETNNQEVLIQVQKVDEGWNVDNVYTISILSNSRGKIKTYVKQLVGRGSRLFREKRKWDSIEGNELKAHEELLHVVTDKGDNFKSFIDEIREELNLSAESFSEETETLVEKNPINAELKEANQILPSINTKKEIEQKELLNNLSSLVNIETLISEHTYSENQNIYLNKGYQSLGEEVSIDTPEKVEESEATFDKERLELTDEEVNYIIRGIISENPALPSHRKVREELREKVKSLNSKEIYYKDFYDESDSKTKVVEFIKEKLSSIASNEIEGHYQPSEEIEHVSIKEIFSTRNIKKEVSPADETPTNIKKVIEGYERDSDSGRAFKDFKKAYYTYNKFDSKQEFLLAKLLDSMDDVEYWIRNMGNYSLGFGLSNEYVPDFVVATGEETYVIEVKMDERIGEDIPAKTESKYELLRKLENEGMSSLLLSHKDVENKIVKQGPKQMEDLKHYDKLKR